MNVFIVITSFILSHAPLLPHEGLVEKDLVQAIQATWNLKLDKATVLAKGALLGGQLGNIHPAWLLSIAYYESRFNPKARGDCSITKGGKKRCKARGLCQIHYGTGKPILRGLQKKDLFNPIINMAVAGLLYGKYIRKYGRRKAHVIYASGNRCPKCTTTPSFKKRYKLMKKLIRNIKKVK